MNISVIRYVKTLVLLFVMLGAPALALAHKVSMFAYVEGDQIFLEGYFADGKKALNSKVEAFDLQGKEVWSGTTNDKGEVTFPVPKVKGDLRITLTASMGHKAEYVLKAAEMAGEPDATESAAVSTTASNEEVSGGGAASSSGGMAGVSQTELRRIVRREVGEAVMPVVRGLSELKERRGISDIVGGIGIIGGIMGVYFFLQARKIREGSNNKT